MPIERKEIEVWIERQALYIKQLHVQYVLCRKELGAGILEASQMYSSYCEHMAHNCFENEHIIAACPAHADSSPE